MPPAELAELLGIKAVTLRKWSRDFAVHLSATAQTPPQGQERRYSDSDIVTLQRVRDLKAHRYDTREVLRALSTPSSVSPRVGLPVTPGGISSDIGQQVTVIDQSHDAAMLREMLAAYRETLEAQRVTNAAQTQVIEQQRAQLDTLERGLHEAKDELCQVVEKIPGWLRFVLRIR